jgi:hypothetical protein
MENDTLPVRARITMPGDQGIGDRDGGKRQRPYRKHTAEQRRSNDQQDLDEVILLHQIRLAVSAKQASGRNINTAAAIGGRMNSSACGIGHRCWRASHRNGADRRTSTTEAAENNRAKAQMMTSSWARCMV